MSLPDTRRTLPTSAVAFKLNKRVISQFIRTGCRRRLRLDLYAGDKARASADAPAKDTGRPGLALLQSLGKQYERQKYGELEQVFPGIIRGNDVGFQADEEQAFSPIELAAHIAEVKPNSFILEAQFEITPAFISANNLQDLHDGTIVADGARLEFDQRVRPDIIQVRPPSGTVRRIITLTGTIEELDPSDTRLGLRVIDIKIAGEPSPGHFAELAYYGMALSAWLRQHNYERNFVVLAEAAIWPGNHEGSTIDKLDREDRKNRIVHRDLDRYLEGFEADLETMPPEVILGRLTRFLAVDLREVLTALDWRQLPWHIDNRCAGCDYLGYRWTRHDSESTEAQPPGQGPVQEPRYCWPTAEREGHLSRIAGLTEGACGKLREANIDSLTSLSTLPPTSRHFDRHQTLRAKRVVLRERAIVLSENALARIPDRVGTSAVLPRFADIRVSLSADFDVGSGFTFAFGYRIGSGTPAAERPRGPDGPRYARAFSHIDRPLLVERRSLEEEGATFRKWLDYLVQDVMRFRGEVLSGYRQFDPAKKDVTIQFFIWDHLIFDHLCRVVGRHLQRLQAPTLVGQVEVSPISWLFPAEQQLKDPDFIARTSPITIISDAINGLVAAPIPHHYGLIDLANSIDPDRRKRADGTQWWFHVNKFYRDPLSDQVPSERGNELWERKSPFVDKDWQWHQEELRKVVRRKLDAVNFVTEALTRELQDSLTAEAPRVADIFLPIDRLPAVGDDGQLFYQHSRLMAAAQQLENDLLMAMPPYEREARFWSARVERTFREKEREEVLKQQRLNNLIPDRSVLAFRLCGRSREVHAKEGEYLWSFMPEPLLAQIQHLTRGQFKSRYPALTAGQEIEGWEWRRPVRASLAVEILRIDRAGCVLIVRAKDLLKEALDLGLIDLDFDITQGKFGILDPITMDAFTPKLRAALSGKTNPAIPGIRNPPLAVRFPLFPNAGIARVKPSLRPRATATIPCEPFIWDAGVLALTPVESEPDAVLSYSRRWRANLTARQEAAIRQSVGRRLAVWWGPPGTGKSATAQAYVAGLLGLAVEKGTVLRVAITGFTWVAIDNVAKRIPEILRELGISEHVDLFRLSSRPGTEGIEPLLHPYVMSMDDARSNERTAIEQSLATPNRCVIVAGTVDQLSKLGDGAILAPLFDVMLIDEASQMDVGHSLVGFTKLAQNAHVTIVGDDKQMAPIHPIEPPDGTEHLLGSVYDFYRRYRTHEAGNTGIQPIMLDRSFRSNREIIDFVRLAGYPDLVADAANAGLRIATNVPFASVRPPDWPDKLSWTEHFATILNPDQPLACIVHSDRYSSQRNDDEANLVAGLVLTLYRARLLGIKNGNCDPFNAVQFFRDGIGIVTPHRAQQSSIYERLSDFMPPEIDRNEIFAAIDTVERFQGQEKTVIIASFGLGDADQIAAEEKFLYSLNRFNVAASRAKAKFIAILSRQLVDHLPRDRRALEESRLLKHFADGFLGTIRSIDLPGLNVCEFKVR